MIRYTTLKIFKTAVESLKAGTLVFLKLDLLTREHDHSAIKI